MYCPNCGQIIPEDVIFCNNCGSKISTSSNTCIKCGALLNDGDVFCGECGTNQETYISSEKNNIKRDNSEIFYIEKNMKDSKTLKTEGCNDNSRPGWKRLVFL